MWRNNFNAARKHSCRNNKKFLHLEIFFFQFLLLFFIWQMFFFFSFYYLENIFAHLTLENEYEYTKFLLCMWKFVFSMLQDFACHQQDTFFFLSVAFEIWYIFPFAHSFSFLVHLLMWFKENCLLAILETKYKFCVFYIEKKTVFWVKSIIL